MEWRFDRLSVEHEHRAPDLNNPAWKSICANWNVPVDASDSSKGILGCSAQTQLNELSNRSTNRKIVTSTGISGGGQGIQFQPYTMTPPTGTTTLSSAQQGLLRTTIDPTPDDSADVVAYLRGDGSNDGSKYRNRQGHFLGDIMAPNQ